VQALDPADVTLCCDSPVEVAMGNGEVTSVKDSLNVVTTVGCPEGSVPDVSNCV
jgi:hypothetical protein